MTSPHVSEQEVEAAARAMDAIAFMSPVEAREADQCGCDACQLERDTAREVAMANARAALTAAAQMRAMSLQDHAADEPMPAIDTAQSLHDLEGAYRSICIHNERLRASLLPCVGWLDYAYGNVSSVTATAVKAHLPTMRAILAEKSTEPDSGPDVLGERKGASDG